MGLIAPTLPDVDVDEFRALTRAEKNQVMTTHWASHGFGTPQAIYLLYAAKIALYVLGGALFVTATPGIGTLGEWRDWWTEPVVLQKAVAWTLLFEVLGFGCGFGPLTLRFLPPIGTFLYWLRPGTIRQPPWPGRVPLTAGTRRSIVDVLLSPVDSSQKIEALRFVPLIVVLPLLGLRDKAIFLAARAEHYWVALFIVMMPFADMIVAAQLLWLCLWWGAATSKLNQHFPYVVATMVSNAPLYPTFMKRRMWRDHTGDIRPSRTAMLMAHGGTVFEYSVPLILLLSSGGAVTDVALVALVVFHVHIITCIPMGVPLEWNVMMIFGALYLFGHYAAVDLGDTARPWLVLLVFGAIVATVLYGNLRPRQVSFLPSMRYYAGNWPTSAWLFGTREDGTSVEQIYQDRVPKAAPLPHRQLAKLYDEATVDFLVGKVGAFRGLHTHGRALIGLYPNAADDHEQRFIVDGELVAGSAIGWNFGDGHLHDEQLLAAIQERCQLAPGDLRIIVLESQPLGRPVQPYRIYDAADGLLETGEVPVADMLTRQPWEGVERLEGSSSR